ncbi:MAG TPA: hypothetical protein DCE41_05365 [Cytophagales bacterium]|nr:hypothetical protein [Cytophagales bacterium]HAA24384.1 hypothetical protein [Cytophagales bacterium]HAP59523.1 hypothetical protein [Cytophagales bacterium]
MPFLFRSVIFAATCLFPYLLLGQIDTVQALDSVNSPYDEQAPVLDPVEKALYFTVTKHPENVGGIKDQGDIWVSMPDSTGDWGVPQRVAVLNNQDYNAALGFSPSGDTLYLHGWYTGGESVYMKGVSYTVRTDTGWAKPKRLTVKFFKNVAPHQSGTLSPDGKVMLLSLEAFSGRGAEDLYVAYRQPDGSYTGLKNVGDDINTDRQEMTPYLSPDGETLYFASNRNQGTGRDLYRSKRLDETYRSWSAPEMLDTTINTTGIELYFTIDLAQEWAYFTSNQNSEGYGDIYRFRLPPPPVDSTRQIDSLAPDTLPLVDTPLVDSLLISVVDSLVVDTGSVVEVATTPMDSSMADTTEIGYNEAVAVADSVMNTEADSLDRLGWSQLRLQVFGEGDSLLRSAKVEAHWADTTWMGVWEDDSLVVGYPDTLTEFDLRISAPRYFAQEHTFNLADSLVFFSFSLDPIAVGATVKLESVLFRRGSDEMFPESSVELDEVVKLMEENPKMEIELGGHTDNRGNPLANVELSEARVATVKAYLVAAGIAAGRIQGKGYGGAKPISENTTEESRAKNRRVEMKVISNDD